LVALSQGWCLYASSIHVRLPGIIAAVNNGGFVRLEQNTGQLGAELLW
jgi:hypothetical protein